MKKLIILQGVPASGKSTWVKEYMKDHALDTYVVSRDEIRMRSGSYNHDNEKEVTRIEEEETEAQMLCGNNIINDATNLNPKHLPRWEKLAAKYGYEIEYVKFHVPIREAIARDKNPDRTHHVGEKVIKVFYRAYYPDEYTEYTTKTVNRYRLEQDATLPKAVICDLDGTLAWMQGRSPYSTKDVDKDKMDPQLAMLLNILMAADIHVLFTSGRMDDGICREKTMKWLLEGLDPAVYDVQKFSGVNRRFSLLMRKNKDYRGDEIVKKEIFETQIKPFYNVVCAFDDRNKVVNMWRDLGLLCCQVADGDF